MSQVHNRLGSHEQQQHQTLYSAKSLIGELQVALGQLRQSQDQLYGQQRDLQKDSFQASTQVNRTIDALQEESAKQNRTQHITNDRLRSTQLQYQDEVSRANDQMDQNFRVTERVLHQQQNAIHQLNERSSASIAFPPPAISHDRASSSTAFPPVPPPASRNLDRYCTDPFRSVPPDPTGIGFIRPDITYRPPPNPIVPQPLVDYMQQQKLAHPPEFAPNRSSSWKKEMLYYRDLYR